MIFILCTEILALNVRQDNLLEGIKVNGRKKSCNLKISQYADDTTLFLNSFEQVIVALDTVSKFSHVSGLKLNLHKTEGLLLGPLKTAPINISGIIWSKDSIRYLGIYIGHNQKECIRKNWIDKIEKMQKLTDVWRKRNLTLFGKITILKTLAIPSLVFTASMLPIPDPITKDINKILFNFVWKKRDRIKRRTLFASTKQGGLNMIDIESHFSALKAAWIPRLLADQNSNWSFIGNEYLNQFGPFFLVLNMSFDNIKSFRPLEKIPKFYQEIIIAFNKSKTFKIPQRKSEIHNQLLWGNKYVSVYDAKLKCQSTLFFKEWIDCNIMRVEDILSAHGKINFDGIFSKLKDKRNYFSQVSLLTKCLKPYCLILESNHAVTVSECPNTNLTSDFIIFPTNDVMTKISDQKSNFFYRLLIDKILLRPKAELKWIQDYNVPNLDFGSIYIKKIKEMPDKKIAEFNYKILMRIVACGSDLYKWKKVSDPGCIYCKQTPHDLFHLLYNCPYVKILWNRIEVVLHLNILWKTVALGINLDPDQNILISTINYIIYKKWILDSNPSEKTNCSIVHFVRKELIYRSRLCSFTKKQKYVEHLYQNLAKCLLQ